MSFYRQLLMVSMLLAFGVVTLGAFVRASDAGLGCPDWPGCYGHLVGLPDTGTEHAEAMRAFPGKPLDTGKAWKEMTHRYFAGTLGLLVLAIGVTSWRLKISRALTCGLFAVIVAQALLGMWTVTRLLKPVVVTAHLLGGMTTLAMLVALLVGSSPRRVREPESSTRLRFVAITALLALIVQIALGAWVSSNYAALACPDFPTCGGLWRPESGFDMAFTFARELGMTADGAYLPVTSLMAIHWSHRVGAIMVSLTIAWLAFGLWQLPHGRRRAVLLLGLLATQVGLGILNVVLSLPLALAVAHNFVAALLLAVTLTINLQLHGRVAR
jgi:cytochrome c oxidase assembly protein subunit 15